MKRIVVTIVAILIAGVGGYAIGQSGGSNDAKAAKPAKQAKADTAATADCTKATQDPCDPMQEREADRESSGFSGGGTRFVHNLYVGSDDNRDTAMNSLIRQLESNAGGEPYVILGGTDGNLFDLNHRAGGHYVFMGYTMTRDRSKAMTSVAFEMPERARSVDDDYWPQGVKGPRFELLGNLNAPAGKSRPGVYIYGSNSDGGTPANGIPYVGFSVVTCRNANSNCYTFRPPYARPDAGWERFHIDLNRGVGGNYIYLESQRAAG